VSDVVNGLDESGARRPRLREWRKPVVDRRLGELER